MEEKIKFIPKSMECKEVIFSVVFGEIEGEELF